MFKEDILTVEVLPDGTLKISTDEVSAANHSSAEDLLKALESTLGAPAERKRRKGGKVHSHQGVLHSH